VWKCLFGKCLFARLCSVLLTREKWPTLKKQSYYARVVAKFADTYICAKKKTANTKGGGTKNASI